MKTKQSIAAALSLLICFMTGWTCWGDPPDTWVIWETEGNSLIVYGGPKDELDAFMTTPGYAVAGGFWDGSYALSDETVFPYGDGAIHVAFTTRVDWGNHLFNLWRTVSGRSVTYWTGSNPQSVASKIRFGESVTFRGLGVSLTIPDAAGASVAGNTVTWSYEEDSGQAWGLAHAYSGLSATSSFVMTSVLQASSGDYFFGGANAWVSVVAHARKSP
ncbi:hypothetical protein KKG90_10175 [Candidatus Bipolaricaulota bacterium]|nr:hypothetical protein [Candidatus Bipolaricaulota bacterium]